MGGIKPLSGKIIFHIFAIVLFLLGSGLVETEEAKWSTLLLLFGAALVLITEIGMKKFFSWGESREITTYVSTALVIVLLVAGIWRFIANGLPDFLVTINAAVVTIASIWILVEAWY